MLSSGAEGPSLKLIPGSSALTGARPAARGRSVASKWKHLPFCCNNNGNKLVIRQRGAAEARNVRQVPLP